MCLIKKKFLIIGRCKVWRPPNTRYERQYVVPTRKSGRANRSFWAWASGDGPGDLVEIERRMTALDYRIILNDVLLPGVIGRYPLQERVYVVEDNSGVHTANIIREWYENNPRLSRLPHPPKSPDLNFMENIWAKMVADSRANYVANVDNLRERVVNSWEQLHGEAEYFAQLSASMPRRLQRVIENNGWYTKY